MRRTFKTWALSSVHYWGNYLELLHLPLDADAVQRFRAVGQLCEAPLSGTEPVAEGGAEAVGVLDGPQLLLQLLDGLLFEGRGFEKVRERRLRDISDTLITKKNKQLPL